MWAFLEHSDFGDENAIPGRATVGVHLGLNRPGLTLGRSTTTGERGRRGHVAPGLVAGVQERGREPAPAQFRAGRGAASWSTMTHGWARAQGRHLGVESVLPMALGPVNGERRHEGRAAHRAATGEGGRSGWRPSQASVSARVDVGGWILAACGVPVSVVIRRREGMRGRVDRGSSRR